MVASKQILFSVACLIVIVPASAFALVKPLRVIFPEIVGGVSCYDGGVCTDDRERLGEVRALYTRALLKTQASVGVFHSRPRVTFCSTLRCFGSFGSAAPAAHSFGTFGVVVAPRGWQEFYLVHEFIHYRQAEELGMLSLRRKPQWLIEGMAYSMSEDPRRPLPQPMQTWRGQFEGWHAALRGTGIWAAARKVR